MDAIVKNGGTKNKFKERWKEKERERIFIS